MTHKVQNKLLLAQKDKLRTKFKIFRIYYSRFPSTIHDSLFKLLRPLFKLPDKSLFNYLSYYSIAWSRDHCSLTTLHKLLFKILFNRQNYYSYASSRYYCSWNYLILLFQVLYKLSFRFVESTVHYLLFPSFLHFKIL